MSLIATGYPKADALNLEADQIKRALEYAQGEVDRLSDEAPRKQAAYEEKYNSRLIELVDHPKFKTDKLREAKAKADCASEYLDYKLSEALLKAAHSAVYTYRSELSSWQTKCGNVKAEAEVTSTY